MLMGNKIGFVSSSYIYYVDNNVGVPFVKVVKILINNKKD